MLSEKYQMEQGELEETIQTLQECLQKSEQESCDAEQWIARRTGLSQPYHFITYIFSSAVSIFSGVKCHSRNQMPQAS